MHTTKLLDQHIGVYRESFGPIQEKFYGVE